MPAINGNSEKEQARRARRDCQYTDEERDILRQYKDLYKSTTTHSQRDALLRGNIFPDMFNYWFQREQVMPSETETIKRRQNLCQWIRNNWRPDKSIQTAPCTRKRSVIDVVWRQRREEVLDEIKRLHRKAGGSGEPSADDQFRLRTTAAKNVYSGLDEDKRVAIVRATEENNNDLNPPDIQKKRANKYGTQEVEQWGAAQWKDKGMVTLVFYAFRGLDNLIHVEVSDKMAKNVQGQKRPFLDTYPDLVQNVQVKLLEYLKDLLANAGSTLAAADGRLQPIPSQPSDTGGPTEGDMPNGFPVMPDVKIDDKVRKEDYEQLLRRYLTTHYKLASGQRKSHVPFTLLNQSQRQFIDAKYRPRHVALKDPRNMTKAQIVDFCQHVYKRQELHGHADAFRFAQFYNGKEMVNAEYGTQIGETRAAARASKQKEGRKSKGKEKEHSRGHHQSKEQPPIVEEPEDEVAAARLRCPAVAGSTFAIDPLLLGQVPTMTGSTQCNAAGVEIATGGPAAAANIVVTEGQMQILRSHGYSNFLPMNGPNDGPPLYEVPATATEMLIHADNTGHPDGIDHPHTDIEHLQTPSEVQPDTTRPKRKVRNADRQTIEEGKKLGKRSNGTRANPAKRRR